MQEIAFPLKTPSLLQVYVSELPSPFAQNTAHVWSVEMFSQSCESSEPIGMLYLPEINFKKDSTPYAFINLHMLHKSLICAHQDASLRGAGRNDSMQRKPIDWLSQISARTFSTKPFNCTLFSNVAHAAKCKTTAICSHSLEDQSKVISFS